MNDPYLRRADGSIYGIRPPAVQLSPCCGAQVTFVEGVLCCKVCYEAVPLMEGV